MKQGTLFTNSHTLAPPLFSFRLLDTIGSVESVKAASDIYAPITGTVIEVNTLLNDEPALLNSSPEDEGKQYFFEDLIYEPCGVEVHV